MIRDVLLVQKRELETRLSEKYVDRNIRLKLDNNLVKIIIGPRRAGKSFAAMHALSAVGNFGYVNFDDERLIELKNYDEIVDAINSIYSNPKYLLLDEVQNLEKWELFVNRLQRQGYNLVVTGSNSKLLSKELATHLTGRHLLTTILPFSFKEFLENGEKETTGSEAHEQVLTYLSNGGYPEPLIKKIEYREYLSTLLLSIIYKDIVKRFKIRQSQAIENLAKYLISNVAREFSYNTLCQVTQCKSSHTVQKYLGYLEETFLIFKLNRFSLKVKEQITSSKKIYCTDNGFIGAIAFSPNIDMGKLLENSVAIELKKRELNNLANIFYWKNQQGEEVDFLVMQGNKVSQLIQVCYSLEDPKTKQREIRALLKASAELKCNNLLIITDNYEAETQEEWFGIKGKVKYTPLYKWLKEQ